MIKEESKNIFSTTKIIVSSINTQKIKEENEESNKLLINQIESMHNIKKRVMKAN